MKRNILGQEAIEFALIGGLVFCIAIGTMLIFGNKIASFFENGSAVAKMGDNSPNVVSSITPDKFVPDYETYAANPENPTNSLKSESLNAEFYGDINTIANLSTTIQTSGASGGTDIMTEDLAKEAAKLMDLAKQTSDPDLLKLAQSANELAEIGYYVADAQEWYEKGIEKYTSDGTVTIPDDNKLCEDGRLKAVAGSGCDTTLVSENFLSYSHVQEDFYNMLHGYRTKLVDKCNELKSSNTSDNERINQAIANIDTYVQEISTLSINLHNSVYEILKTTKTPTLDDVLNQVASKTTDYNSSLIEQEAQAEKVLVEETQQ